MANKVKLPWELIEEILSRVPPTSLARFRAVSKQWNALFDDRTFINNHKETFRFILATESKIYSVSINPKIEVHELELDIPGLESQKPRKLVDCNEFVLCHMEKGAVVWNPWLKQARCIEPEVNQPRMKYRGIGYNHDNRSLGYKTLASCVLNPTENDEITCWKVHDLAFDEWKDLPDSSGSSSGGSSSSQGKKISTIHTSTCVSLNGILYFVVFYDRTDLLYHLKTFDFSSKKFFKFCDLPCGMKHRHDALVHKVFREDRFSLLKQSHETKKIEIWVTKNKINHEDGGDVVWTKIMTVTNFPRLVTFAQNTFHSQPSYFIDDKRLVVCSCDDAGRAWIYVAEDNKLIRKIHIDFVVDPWPLHCTFIPNLIPFPRGKREEADIPSLIPGPPCQREEEDSQPESSLIIFIKFLTNICSNLV